jgi:hypothetical protein
MASAWLGATTGALTAGKVKVAKRRESKIKVPNVFPDFMVPP